ncbi:MAG: hypothetical protein WAL10_09485 [Acetobacteraceae bacterium]
MNFAATGLALLLAAISIAWHDRHPLLVVTLAPAGCVALFFCLLTGLLLVYALIAGYQLHWLWPHRRQISAVLVRFAALVPLVRTSACGARQGGPVWLRSPGPARRGWRTRPGALRL